MQDCIFVKHRKFPPCDNICNDMGPFYPLPMCEKTSVVIKVTFCSPSGNKTSPRLIAVWLKNPSQVRKEALITELLPSINE